MRPAVRSVIDAYQLETMQSGDSYILNDPEETARRLAPRKLRNAGQLCAAPNRFFVHDHIHDRFIAAYRQELKAAKIGMALDESSLMGPLVAEKRVGVMEAFCEDATAKGAKIAHGVVQFAEAPFGGVKDPGQGRVGGIERLNAYLTAKASAAGSSQCRLRKSGACAQHR